MDTSAKDCLHLFDTSVEGRLSPGWAAGVLHQRTRTVSAGPMVYVDCYPVWNTAAAGRARSAAKREAQRKAQERMNRKNARKKLERLVNANFGDGDLIVTCEYGHGMQPDGDEAALRNIRSYLRRLAYRRQRRGLERMKYIYITEVTASARYGTRYHHHVIMSGGISRDEAEAVWRSRHGGICNAKAAQPTQQHLSGFARYLTADKSSRTIEEDGKNPQHKAMRRGWTPSRGLYDPDEDATVADKKISIRKAGRIAEAVQDEAFARETFARLYPDCELLEISAKRSEWAAGVYISVKLKRKTERRKRHGGKARKFCGHDPG